MKQLDNKKQVVVITGASTGIGFSTAVFLVNNGYIVYGTYRKSVDAKRIHEKGIRPVLMDVTDYNSIKQAVQVVIDEMGENKLAAVINNAGLSLCVPWEVLDPDDFKHQLEVNLVGPAVVSKYFLPQLKKDKGKIIMISSTAAYYATPIMGPYTCSKVGLEAMADSLRRECWFDGVDVISVRPGPVKTPIFGKTLSRNEKNYTSAIKGSVFGNFRRLNKSLEAEGLEPIVIAKGIARIIKQKKPPTRVMISKLPLINYIMERLPSRWVDWLCVKVVYGRVKEK